MGKERGLSGILQQSSVSRAMKSGDCHACSWFEMPFYFK
jgi:hypothetical protein